MTDSDDAEDTATLDTLAQRIEQEIQRNTAVLAQLTDTDGPDEPGVPIEITDETTDSEDTGELIDVN